MPSVRPDRVRRNQREEVTQGVKLIAQSIRGNSIFSTLPKEVAIKIAVSLADSKYEGEALQIAKLQI